MLIIDFIFKFKRLFFIVLIFFIILSLILILKNGDYNHSTSKNYIKPTSNKLDSRQTEIYTLYDNSIMNQITNMIKRNALYNDRELIDVIRRLIHYPAEKNHLKFSRPDHVVTAQSTAVNEILKNKTGGFFVEAGAFDGEFKSNSAFFEKHRGWTGLLVEMDPYYYMQIVGKNRRAYSINSCISYQSSPIIAPYIESHGWDGRVITDDKKPKADHKTMIPCFPLASLLLAINISHIDYFSMDIEGLELPVLKNIIPDKNMKIDVLTVEYLFSDANGIKTFMAANNYKFVKELTVPFVADYVFAKNGI